jgi:DNA-binding transcriptional MerR regulator
LPYKEKDIEKKYFSIGEVADMFQVAPSLIRYWESEFDTIQPQKNKKGNRQFTKDDIEQFRVIYSLLKEKGYTINGARELLKKDKQKVKNTEDILDALHKVRSFLIDLKKQLDS